MLAVHSGDSPTRSSASTKVLPPPPSTDWIAPIYCCEIGVTSATSVALARARQHALSWYADLCPGTASASRRAVTFSPFKFLQ